MVKLHIRSISDPSRAQDIIRMIEQYDAQYALEKVKAEYPLIPGRGIKELDNQWRDKYHSIWLEENSFRSGNFIIQWIKRDTFPLGNRESYVEYAEILEENTSYCSVIFLSNSQDTEEVLQILDNDGEESAIEYLSQWDNGEVFDCRDTPENGESDHVYYSGEYVLNWNSGLGYIGLEKRIHNE
jgi:hypothetical protein